MNTATILLPLQQYHHRRANKETQFRVEGQFLLVYCYKHATISPIPLTSFEFYRDHRALTNKYRRRVVQDPPAELGFSTPNSSWSGKIEPISCPDAFLAAVAGRYPCILIPACLFRRVPWLQQRLSERLHRPASRRRHRRWSSFSASSPLVSAVRLLSLAARACGARTPDSSW